MKEPTQNNTFTNNFYGDVGSASIKQTANSSTQIALLDSVEEEDLRKQLADLQGSLPELRLSHEKGSELTAAISELTNALSQTKDKKKLRPIAKRISDALTGAAGNMLAEGALLAITNILGQL